MKKLSTLLMMLIVGIGGVWATVTMPTLTTDVNNPTYYTIKNFRSGKYVTYAGPSTQLSQIATPYYASLWYFVENGNGVSIVPAADPSVKLATNASATANGSVWYLKENTYNLGYFCVSLNSDLSNNCWDDNSSHTGVGYWHPSTNDYEGTSWIIEESSGTFSTRKSNIQNIINNLPNVLKPSNKLDALTNADTEAKLKTAVEAFSANVTFKCRSNNYLVVGDFQGAHVASPSNNEEIIQLISVGDGSFYMKGFISTKYMADVQTSTAIQTEANANIPYYIQAKGDYAVARPTKYADNGYNYIHNGGSGCVGWETSANNTQYTITEVDLPTGYVVVTYNIELDGSVLATYTSRQVSGNAAAVPSALQRDYTTYSYNPATIPANDATITVTPAFNNMPFTTSTDYNTATWYYLHGHASYNDRYISTNGTATVFAQGKSAADAYKWAFIGNPVIGIKVINKASGDGSYLMATDPATMGSTAKSWTLRKQTSTSWQCGANGFGLYDNTRTNLNTQGTTLKYWGSFDQGSTFWVQEIPMVNVTFNLEVNNKVVKTIIQSVQEGETVSVPSELLADYSSVAYTISGAEDVTIGTTDQTVTVTATLKEGLVMVSELSNTKKYKLTCERGTLSTYTTGANTYLASPTKTELGISGKDFAILSYGDRYYLYSVDDEKFVTYSSKEIAPLADKVTGTSDAISFQQVSNGVYAIKFDNSSSKYLNNYWEYAYGIVINEWGSHAGEFDEGNQYVIEEIGDFDSGNAIGSLTYYDIISQLKSINWGSPKGQLNHYNFINAYAGYAGNESSIIESFEDNGYSEDNLAVVQGFINNYSLNVPEAGKFYRIQGNTSSKYLAAGLASNNKFAMTDATDATTIFYYDGTKLTNLSSGMCNGANKDAWAWTVNTSASTVAFLDSNTNGGYGIQSKDIYFYDNGDGTDSADRGAAANVDIQSTSLNERYRKWYLTEITEIPVTFKTAGLGYATFFTPVPLQIPKNNSSEYDIHAYVCQRSGNTLTFYDITNAEDEDGRIIPVNTAVLLYNSTVKSGSSDVIANFKISTKDDIVITNNSFTGWAYAKTLPTDHDVYSLRTKDSKVGFFLKTEGDCAGFKAWLETEDKTDTSSGDARTFTIRFDGEGDPTGLIEALGLENENVEIYDLNGRKLSSYKKGINIVNGKKVMVQ